MVALGEVRFGSFDFAVQSWDGLRAPLQSKAGAIAFSHPQQQAAQIKTCSAAKMRLVYLQETRLHAVRET